MQKLIALLSTLFILTACSGPQSETPETPESTEQEQIITEEITETLETTTQSINVTDFAFIDPNSDPGPFAIGSYEGMRTCADSIYAPDKEDNLVRLNADSYAFLHLTANSDQKFTAQWFFEKKHRPLDEAGEEDISADFIHDEWQLMHTEENISVTTTCDGKFVAYSKIPANVLSKYYYSERPFPSGGTYKVTFSQNNKEIGSQNFNGLLTDTFDE